MENKEFKIEETVFCLKRIEFLLEEILTAFVIKNSSDDKLTSNMQSALKSVDDKMKAFFQSLPPSK